MADGFHEVSFPVALSLGTNGGPERRNDIVSLSNGRESRNARWRYSKRRYDAGTGMRDVADLYALIAFFEARQGSLYGFRFSDPIDKSSADYGADITPNDQVIATADGITTVFQLVKNYTDVGGTYQRPIQKPVTDSVRISVDAVEIFSPDIAIDETKGEITFSIPPADGAIITAGYQFDVPVRFDLDQLDINLASFNAGQAPTIPLVEIKP